MVACKNFSQDRDFDNDTNFILIEDSIFKNARSEVKIERLEEREYFYNKTFKTFILYVLNHEFNFAVY